MQESNIKKLFQILKANNVSASEEWYKCSCLFAKFTHKSGKDSNPSAGIHISKHGLSGYSCFSCHTNFHTLDAMLNELAYRSLEHGMPIHHITEASKFIEKEDEWVAPDIEWVLSNGKKEFYKFPTAWLETFSKASAVQEAVDYLVGRDIPQQVCEDFDLRYDYARQAIGFPYSDAQGRLAGMRGRIIDPMAPKLKWHHDYSYDKKNNTSLVWFRESTLDTSKPLIVVEGEFDCARIYQWYRNVTALLTSSASESKLELLLPFTKVYWLTDNDPAGVTSREITRKFFKKHNVEHRYADIFVPEHLKDPAMMSGLEVKYMLSDFVDRDTYIE